MLRSVLTLLSPSSPMLSPSSPMLSPSSPMLSPSSPMLTFRVPFSTGTVSIAYNKPDPFKSEPFDCGFHGAVMAMAAGMIAGLSLCTMIKTVQFNHCAQPSGDPARIAHCAKWLR